MHSTEWPDSSIFSTSSSRRASGTLSSKPLQLADGRSGRGLDLHAQLGRQSHRAQHAHGILAIARRRIADHAQQLVARIVVTAVIVEYLLRGRIVEQRVRREVAPRRILLLVAELVVAQQAAMLVGLGVLGLDHAAEGGDLDHFLAEHHMHQPEAPPDDARAAEHSLDLFRRRIGRDIEILGDTVQQQVTHRTAHDVGLITRRLQPVGSPSSRRS